MSADLGKKRNAELPGLVETLRRVWAREKVVDSLEPVGPPPAQPGGPEMLAGALGPKAVRLAASWADGICGFDWGPSLEGIESTFCQARDAWKQADRAQQPRLMTSFWFALGEGARDQVSIHPRRYRNDMGSGVVEALAEAGSCGARTALAPSFGDAALRSSPAS